MRSFVWLLPFLAAAQQSAPPPAPTIEEYEPRAMLVVPKHEVKRAKYPFIDIHTHQRDAGRDKLDALIRDMDSINMRIMVSSPVSGSFGAKTKAYIDGIRAHPQAKRFASMTNINMKDLPNAPAQLEEDIRNGAIGLKVWKNFGLTEKDASGARIPVDDPRLKPVWAVAAKHKIPVLIHTADPKPLFDPMDKYNERWLELRQRPNRAEAGSGIKWEQLIQEQHKLVANNPQTTFILAHMGWMAHDLTALGALLDKYPNMNVEIAAHSGRTGSPAPGRKAVFHTLPGSRDVR